MGNFCILGWGKTGISTATFLREQGNNVVVWDDHEEKRTLAQKAGFVIFSQNFWTDRSESACLSFSQNSQQPDIRDALIQEPNNDHKNPTPAKDQSQNFSWTNMTVVASPGIGEHPIMTAAIKHKATILSDIQLFQDFFPHIPSIGITGSNGKTTTCALIEHGFRHHGIPCISAGNMGIPIFSTLENGRPPQGIYILELSSYQLELCPDLHLDVALILNLFPHHLERHGTMDNYRAIKETILNHAFLSFLPALWPSKGPLKPWPVDAKPESLDQSVSCPPVLSWRQTRCRAPGTQGQNIPYAFSPRVLEGQMLPHSLRTHHNQENVTAALHVLHAFGCHDLNVFQDFQCLEHRQEQVEACGGVVYCNDSKATNPHASALAIEACTTPAVFWIAGGVLQNDDLSVLTSVMPRITHGFVIGQAKDRYADWMELHGRPVTRCASLDQAVELAHRMAEDVARNAAEERIEEAPPHSAIQQATRDDSDWPKNPICTTKPLVGHWATVLFSPGCASFDQFQNFEHRGHVFKDCVKKHTQSPNKTQPHLSTPIQTDDPNESLAQPNVQPDTKIP